MLLEVAIAGQEKVRGAMSQSKRLRLHAKKYHGLARKAVVIRGLT